MITNLFFDTEFTGLQKDTDLISIGIVDNVGNTFYAEFNDFDINKINSNLFNNDHWIENNVFPNLLFTNTNIYYKSINSTLNSIQTENIYIKDNKEHIKYYLEKFLIKYDQIQFVSDCCHYDFVLLIDLFKSALFLPAKINPYCHDINTDIARYYNISETEAFNMNRLNLVTKSDNILKQSKLNFNSIYHKQQHNALIDAFNIAIIYNEINKDNIIN